MKLFNKKSGIAWLMIAVCMFSKVGAQQKSAIEKPLGPEQQNIITIAAYTAKGDLSKLKRRCTPDLKQD